VIGSPVFVPRARYCLGFEGVATCSISDLATRFVEKHVWNVLIDWDAVDIYDRTPFVYFIGVSGCVKIGYSTEVGKRLLELQRSNPLPLTVHAVMIGPVALEQSLHIRFGSLWVHGEWFRREGALAELLEKAPQ
jgi:hypothetical protein